MFGDLFDNFEDFIGGLNLDANIFLTKKEAMEYIKKLKDKGGELKIENKKIVRNTWKSKNGKNTITIVYEDDYNSEEAADLLELELSLEKALEDEDYLKCSEIKKKIEELKKDAANE